MMRFVSTAGFFIVILMVLGCSSHYYRNQSDAVVFYLKAPKAQTVEIVASCRHFTPQSAHARSRGRWSVSMPQDVSYSYFYLVDGNYFLPPCNFTEQDDFGRSNCIFEPPE